MGLRSPYPTIESTGEKSRDPIFCEWWSDEQNHKGSTPAYSYRFIVRCWSQIRRDRVPGNIINAACVSYTGQRRFQEELTVSVGLVVDRVLHIPQLNKSISATASRNGGRLIFFEESTGRKFDAGNRAFVFSHTSQRQEPVRISIRCRNRNCIRRWHGRIFGC